MRRKQLFAIILAGALAAGSAPAAVFAAESDMAAMSEEGVGNAGSEEAGKKCGFSNGKNNGPSERKVGSRRQNRRKSRQSEEKKDFHRAK